MSLRFAIICLLGVTVALSACNQPQQEETVDQTEAEDDGADAARSVYEAFLLRTRELNEQQGLYTSASRVISISISCTRPPATNSTRVPPL